MGCFGKNTVRIALAILAIAVAERAFAQPNPVVQPLTPGSGEAIPPPPPPPTEVPPTAAPSPTSEFTLPVSPSGVPRLNLEALPQMLKPTGDAMPEPRNPQAKSSRQYNGLISVLINPAFGDFPTLGNYEFSWRPPARVAGQSTNLAFIRNTFNILFPLGGDESDEYFGSVQFRNESFYDTNAVLPTSNRELPHELWDFRVGLGYRHRFDNGWIAGGNVVTGSVADRPFYSYREWYWSLNTYLAIPREGTNDAFLLALLYNNLSTLRYPLPAVAYLYRPSDNFSASIGIPFSLTWRPDEHVTIDLSYVPVRTVHAQVQYMIALPFRVYAAYDWDSEGYFLANRTNYFDALQYYEMRLSFGAKLFLSHHFGFDLATGYAFDRFYFQGRDYSDRDHDRISVSSGPFVTLQALFIW